MPTNNPLPSSSLEDFKDNSIILDHFVNSQEEQHPDRFGRARPTITGIIREAFNVRTDIGNMNETLIGQSRWDDVPKNTSLSLGGDNGALNKQTQALFNRTEMLKVHAREALRRTYQEVGLVLVPGSFEAGGTLQSVTDVLLEEKTGKVYSWTGSFPKVVIKGTLPSSDVLFVEKTQTYLKDVVSPYIKDTVCLNTLSHLVTNDDWTAAFNYAIANYTYIIPEKDKTYKITGIVTGRVGTKFVGELKINPMYPRLQNLGVFTVDTSKRSTGIKALYVFGTFDLIEMLYIKSMGFNLVQHGAYFQFNAPDLDRHTHIVKALDSASVANLDVILTSGWITQEDSQAVGTANLYDYHPALVGYGTFDEPSFNGVSYTRQNERINALRAVTNKSLSVVDNAGHSDWFAAPGVIAKNYDMVFIDVYPNKLGVERSICDILLAHTVIKNATGNAKLIPVAGCFLGTNYSTDLTILKAISKRHCMLSGDNLGFWGWDPVEDGITSIALNNPDLRDMMLSMMQPHRKVGNYDFFYVGKNKSPTWIQEPIKSMELTTDTGTSAGIFFHALEHGAADTATESINVEVGQTLTGIFALEGTNEMITNISIKSDSVLKGVIGNVNGNSSLTLNISALTPTNKRILLFSEGYTFTAQAPSQQVGPIFIPFSTFAGCKISIAFNSLSGMGVHPRTFFQMMFAGER